MLLRSLIDSMRRVVPRPFVCRTNALLGLDGERLVRLHPAGDWLRVVQRLQPLLRCIR
jgi:hypothetical protein